MVVVKDSNLPEKPNVSEIIKLAEADGVKLTHAALTKHLRAVGVQPKKEN